MSHDCPFTELPVPVSSSFFLPLFKLVVKRFTFVTHNCSFCGSCRVTYYLSFSLSSHQPRHFKLSARMHLCSLHWSFARALALTFLLPFFSLSPSLATGRHFCSARLLLCMTLLINLLGTVLGALTLLSPTPPPIKVYYFSLFIYMLTPFTL